MNKLIIITLTISSTILLIDQNILSAPVEKTDPITITPFYLPEIPNEIRESINNAIIKQQINEQKQIELSKKIDPQPPIKPAEWLLESAIKNAPGLLKGIIFYLQSRSFCINESQQVITIPSCHRFILVGPPGSGKTTLAYAIAHMLGYRIVFIPATTLLGNFRNETANNIHKTFTSLCADGAKIVIIIDELHKLFEHHKNDRSDDSQSAAAFWLILDTIEKNNHNAIIIGTANNVDKLPPEIKSRFSGKIITMPTTTKKQQIQAFKNNIAHDKSVVLDKSITDKFITNIIQQIQNCSLRDIQLVIDTAKMFNYAKKTTNINQFPIILTKTHFQEALNQLKIESCILQETFSDKLCKTLQPYGIVFAIAANICVLVKTSFDLFQAIPNSIKNNGAL